jgi:hypothetical protein
VDLQVRNIVNSLLTSDLSELQKNCRKMVDFGFQNVKWYHLIHLSIKVVVLCYSLNNLPESHNRSLIGFVEPAILYQ